jgi:p21-activated kinase 2
MANEGEQQTQGEGRVTSKFESTFSVKADKATG